MLIGLESFSYHLAFAYGKMNVLGFIKRTADLGLDGVEILAEGDDLCHLGSDDPGFLREVRALIDGLGLYAELDTCDTDPRRLTRALHICHALGADRLRVYSSVGGEVKREIAQAVKDFRQVIGLCADYGVKIGYENHEHETSQDVLEVVRQVGSEYVGAHIDTGNSMMIWEDPLAAVTNMASRAVSTHFKDHMVILVNGQPMVVGVPLGRGSIDCAKCFQVLAKQSPLERVSIEVCYGYIAPFHLPEAQGFGGKLGQGAFRIQPPPYDPAVVAPFLLRCLDEGIELQSFGWRELAKAPRSEAERQELLVWQDQAVIESVAYVKKLNA
jgi:sugar phosphate isomerase/epimerase